MRWQRSKLPLAVACTSGVGNEWAADLAGGMGLRLPLRPVGGIAIESAASTMRVILFLVPGGLVTQEAGVVGAGFAFGLAAPEIVGAGAGAAATRSGLRSRIGVVPVLEYRCRHRNTRHGPAPPVSDLGWAVSERFAPDY